MSAIKIFKWDDKRPFEFTVRDENDIVVNLTTAGVTTAECYIRKDGAAANKFTAESDIECTIVDAPNGRINYLLPVGGIDEVGSYIGQVMLFYSGTPTREEQCERFMFSVEEGLRAQTPTP